MMLLVVIFPLGKASATKHVINVQNYSFSPSSITDVIVGDTMRWVWVSGTHTTTSTTIPASAATWDHPITSTNTSFEYKVTVAGTYNYKCTPHASMGMVGSFIASSSAATLSVLPANQNVTAGAGSTTFSVTSNSNWTAVCSSAWCTVTPSGSGNGTITANYSSNISVLQRIATITVTVTGLPSQNVTVTQAGAAPTLAVLPANQDVTSDAGSTSFTVTSNTGWTIVSNATWCTVPSSGSGNGSIAASYTANSSVIQRVATITVTVTGLPSQNVTVTQAGAAPTLAVDPPNQNVGYLAGTTTFNVSSNTSWTTSSDREWCTATPSGTGNGAITVTYIENPTNVVRVAMITINVTGLDPVMVTVTQDLSSVSVNIIPGKAFRISPNPTKGKFVVSLGNINNRSVKISVLDAIGTKVYNEWSDGTEYCSIDLSTFPRGSYFVRVVTDEGVKVGKLLLTK